MKRMKGGDNFCEIKFLPPLNSVPGVIGGLQESEVSEVKWISYNELESAIAKGHPEFVPFDDPDTYIKVITLIKER